MFPLCVSRSGSQPISSSEPEQISRSGGADARDQARARLDPVRVLQRGRRRIDRHLVSAQLLRQSAPFGLAGKDVERRRRRQRSNGQA